jgi:hypothetical protein
LNIFPGIPENLAGIHDTVDGRNPAPVDRWFIPLFNIIYMVSKFQPSKVMQDFFHLLLSMLKCTFTS